jgi:hypothetical protein
LASPSLINAQNININCVFTVVGANYDCVLASLFIPDNEQLTFTVGGIHQPGLTNVNVTRVIITNSLVPFVITQFFTTFPGLQQYHYTDSFNPTRVQNNAFLSGSNLQEITIARTTGLVVFPNSFSGANALLRLNLQSNMLADVPQGLLTGLTQLQWIDFSNNQIQSVAEVFLRGQTQVTTINLNNNLLTRIPNTLLNSNIMLSSFSAQTNRIYQIGSRFLDNLNSLTTLSLSGNECISQNWSNIGGTGGPSKDAINQALATCFNNYLGGGNWRNYGFQLRGTARLYDEDNNLVGQLTG